MSSFTIALTAVAPFVIYIMFGVMSRKVGWADEGTLHRFNAIVFQCFFPVMMFSNMYHAGEGTGLNASVVIFIYLGVFALIGVMMALMTRVLWDNAKRGVFVQAVYRSNIVLFALPMMTNVYGEGARAMATMVIGTVVPLYNVMAVVVLEYYNGSKPEALTLLKKIVTNPLIIGILTGFLFRLLQIPLASSIDDVVTAIADMSTPLALFILGGTLNFGSAKEHAPILARGLVIKMTLVPLAAYALAYAAGYSAVERFLILIVFATPVATSSFPMAENMGGDGALAGEFVVTSTLVSLLTLFIFIFTLNVAGLM